MASTEPLVSIIIPTYNCADSIVESIDSVLAQTKVDFEIIVIDDGSLDNTRDLLDQYIKNKQIRYIYQSNKGVSAARNLGIKSSIGKYIAFLDADDIFLPNSLKKRVDVLEENPDISFVFTDFFFERTLENKENIPIFREWNIVKKLNEVIERESNNVYLFTKRFFHMAYIKSIFPCTITVMARKECFNKVGLFDVRLRISEDEDLYMRIAALFKVGYIDEPLSVYKKYRSTATRDQQKYYSDLLDYLKVLLDRDIIKSDYELINAVRRRIAYYYSAFGYYCFSVGNYKMARNLYKKSINIEFSGIKKWMYLFFSYFPPSLIKLIRYIKHKI